MFSSFWVEVLFQNSTINSSSYCIHLVMVKIKTVFRLSPMRKTESEMGIVGDAPLLTKKENNDPCPPFFSSRRIFALVLIVAKPGSKMKL